MCAASVFVMFAHFLAALCHNGSSERCCVLTGQSNVWSLQCELYQELRLESQSVNNQKLYATLWPHTQISLVNKGRCGSLVQSCGNEPLPQSGLAMRPGCWAKSHARCVLSHHLQTTNQSSGVSFVEILATQRIAMKSCKADLNFYSG